VISLLPDDVIALCMVIIVETLRVVIVTIEVVDEEMSIVREVRPVDAAALLLRHPKMSHCLHQVSKMSSLTLVLERATSKYLVGPCLLVVSHHQKLISDHFSRTTELYKHALSMSISGTLS
jgi:hypothetical protein